MLNQDILEQNVIFSALAWSANLNEQVPYRRIGSAFDGDPREPEVRAQIIAVGNSDYLVPEERTHEGSALVSVSFRIDQAKKIESRPDSTRRISEMKLSADVTADVRAALTASVEQDNPPIHKYKVCLIQPNV